jgi:hypothetical protein
VLQNSEPSASPVPRKNRGDRMVHGERALALRKKKNQPHASHASRSNRKGKGRPARPKVPGASRWQRWIARAWLESVQHGSCWLAMMMGILQKMHSVYECTGRDNQSSSAWRLSILVELEEWNVLAPSSTDGNGRSRMEAVTVT